MSSNLTIPHYQSYVYQWEQYTIYTCECIDWNGNISLFSMIVTPGHATRHSWTWGEQHGDGYIVTCKDTSDHYPGQITHTTSYLPQPSFSVLDATSSNTATNAPSTPLCYGAFYIPLPETTCPGGCHSECDHIPTPIRRSVPQPSPFIHTSYPEPFIPSTNPSCPPPYTVPSPIILLQSFPVPPFGVPRESQDDLRDRDANPRGHKQCQEELSSSTECNGGPKKARKRSGGLDRGLDASY